MNLTFMIAMVRKDLHDEDSEITAGRTTNWNGTSAGR